MALTPAQRRRRQQRRRNQQQQNRQNQRPQFALPEIQLPPFLMELLGGADDYVPRADGALHAEAQRMANAQIAPGMSQIRSLLRGGSQTINELTREVAGRMAPIAGQVGQIYGAAGAQTQGFEDAMANRLLGLGLDTQDDLTATFQKAGLDAALPLAQGVGDVGKGASQASFATGATALQRLAAEGASQQSYAAALPGVASLGGQAALAALTREANAQAAGLSAQAPGLAMDAYRSLRSSEDARADAANANRKDLASMLMDWNQNMQNLAFQTYATDLGFFGDRQDARDAAQQFLAEMGYKYDALAQDQTQFEIGEANDQAAAAADAEQDALAARGRATRARDDYIDSWTKKALSQADKLGKGFFTEGTGAGTGIGSQSNDSPKRIHHEYTYSQAQKRLTKFLESPLRGSAEAKRYGLKDKLIRRIVAEALESAGFTRPRVTGGRNRQFGPTLR